jgi:hypothetical protein
MDSVMSSQGSAQLPYGRKGNHVVRLERLTVREAKGDVKAAFMLDCRVLFTDNADGSYSKGSVIRFQDPFKFPDKTKPLIRRCLHIAKQSLPEVAKNGAIDELTLGLKQNDGETEDDFKKRISSEAERLSGVTQPLVGSIFVINAIEKKNQNTGKPYTLFEPALATREDLVRAGLVKE